MGDIVYVCLNLLARHFKICRSPELHFGFSDTFLHFTSICSGLNTFSHIFLPWVYFKLTYNLRYRSVISKDSTLYLSAPTNRLKLSGKHVYLLICHMKLYIAPTRCNVYFYMKAIFSSFGDRNWIFVLFGRISLVKERSLIFCLPVWTCLNTLRKEYSFLKLIAEAGFDK